MSSFAPLESRRDVWLNDLPFSNVDDLGNRWIVTDIDGWWDLPPMDMGEVDRAYSEDGSYYEPGRFSSRALRLTGKIIPPTNKTNAANLARQEFNKRLILVRKTGLLQVMESDELGGGKQAEVVVVARPLMQADRLNGVIDFDVQFRAPDPRKYSVDLSTVEAFIVGSDTDTGRRYGLVYNRSYEGSQAHNTALVDNTGDYNTYGVIRLHGPVDAPGAHHHESGRYISFPDVRLAVGQFIDVNLAEKTIVSESGISLRERMSDGSRWFNFDAGPSRVSLLGEPYMDYVPSVPDMKNLVQAPSFEADTNMTIRTVRENNLRNPSGLTSTTTHTIRERLFSDPQAQDPGQYAEGTVDSGYISGPTTTLLYQGSTEFPYEPDGMHHFVQMELNPDISNTSEATLSLGTHTSGSVPITQGEWTTIRVDSHVPDEDYEVSLQIPGASESSRVQVRNIMVVRSVTPVAAEYPFWDASIGTDDDGITTTAGEGGTYLQSYSTPDYIEAEGAELRVITDAPGVEDGMYLIPDSVEPQVVDFGPASTSGTDITYGVLAEGVSEVRLYDADTGELLDSSVPTHLPINYVSETAITPRLEATIEVSAAGSPVRRKITGAMITFDGGTTIFTEATPNYGGYYYETFSEDAPAVENIESFVPPEVEDGHHTYALTTPQMSFDGSRSLEIVYSKLPDDPDMVLTTPVSLPDTPVPGGTYYVRARVSSNVPTTVDVAVEGIDEPTYHSISVNPNHWSSVSFSFDTTIAETPYITVKPTSGGRDVRLYVDSVGILTDDVEYFDGDTPGPYTWSGTPHSSTSATIPVVGVPHPSMEIMYRNAWIG